MAGLSLTILKVVTSLVSIGLYMSPIPMMWRVHRAQHLGETQLLPLVGMLVNCCAWAVYGFFSDDIFPLSISCIYGDILAIGYIAVFVRLTSDRGYAARVCGVGALVCVALVLYAGLASQGVTNQSTHSISLVVGYITVVINCLFYSSPLATMRHVIRTQCAASIPIDLCVMSTISNALWMTYGCITSDMFLFIPNIACTLVGVAQILLYAKYRPSTHKTNVMIAVELTPKHCDNFAIPSPSFHAIHSPLAALKSVKEPEQYV